MELPKREVVDFMGHWTFIVENNKWYPFLHKSWVVDYVKRPEKTKTLEEVGCWYINPLTGK